MVKVAWNRRAAVLLARVLLVCSFFAIGLAPPVKAESFEYTVTFGGDTYLSQGLKLTTAISFTLPTLLSSDFVNIDPGNVQVLEAPVAFAPDTTGTIFTTVASSLFSVTANDNAFFVAFLYQRPTGFWERNDSYSMIFNSPITGVGVYQSDKSQLTDVTQGNDPLGMSFNTYGPNVQGDSVTVKVTPEPNSGLMFGGCFLLCAAVALRRRIRIAYRNYS